MFSKLGTSYLLSLLLLVQMLWIAFVRLTSGTTAMPKEGDTREQMATARAEASQVKRPLDLKDQISFNTPVSSAVVAKYLTGFTFDWTDPKAEFYQALSLSEQQVADVQASIRDVNLKIRTIQLERVKKVSDAPGNEYILIPSLSESKTIQNHLLDALTKITDAQTGLIISSAIAKNNYNYGESETHVAILSLPNEIHKSNARSEDSYKIQVRMNSGTGLSNWQSTTLGKQLFEERYRELFEVAIEKAKNDRKN